MICLPSDKSESARPITKRCIVSEFQCFILLTGAVLSQLKAIVAVVNLRINSSIGSRSNKCRQLRTRCVSAAFGRRKCVTAIVVAKQY